MTEVGRDLEKIYRVYKKRKSDAKWIECAALATGALAVGSIFFWPGNLTFIWRLPLSLIVFFFFHLAGTFLGRKRFRLSLFETELREIMQRDGSRARQLAKAAMAMMIKTRPDDAFLGLIDPAGKSFWAACVTMNAPKKSMTMAWVKWQLAARDYSNQNEPYLNGLSCLWIAVLYLFYADIQYDSSVTRRPQELKGMFADAAEFYVKDLNDDFKSTARELLTEIHARACHHLEGLSEEQIKAVKAAFPTMELIAKMPRELSIGILIDYARKFSDSFLLFEYVVPFS